MQRDSNFFDVNRGVSTAVGYTALLAVTAILLMTILTGANSIVSGQTATVATDQLETTGATLSDEIITVHRMATKSTEADPQITSTVSLPERTVEGQYLIQATNQNITLQTTNEDITVITPLPSGTDTVDITTDGRIDGGDVTISYNGTGDITITEA